jgi:3-deoxy-D-arabino-heptulosonate 7-phosphate (DAHP) synthase
VRAARAVGAHGVMVEIHPDPEHALSDGLQSLELGQFALLARELAPASASFPCKDHATAAA